MKPDWKDAPSWANWLAQDVDCKWCWFEYEPEPDELGQRWLDVEGSWEYVKTLNHRWQDTIENKP